MKKLAWFSPLIASALLAGPQQVAAQEGGIGGILDWIHRLSGPQFVGLAGSAYYARPSAELIGEERGEILLRFSVAYRVSVDSDDQIDPDGSRISMLSIHPSLELPLTGPLDLNIGVARHRFGGDADDFWHWSIPVYLQTRFPVDGVNIRLGTGVHYFFEFDTLDFSPLTVDVSRDGGEFVLATYLGIDVPF